MLRNLFSSFRNEAAHEAGKLAGQGAKKVAVAPVEKKVVQALGKDVRVGAPVAKSALTRTPPNRVSSAAEMQHAYQAANRKLVGKYPTLDVVLKDPDAFIATMKARFEAQKKLTPATPYKFDFSEYGMPVVKTWVADLEGEVAKVTAVAAKLKPGTAAHAEAQQVLAHLGDLQKEVAGHIKAGKIDYQRMQELAYYLPGAMGRYDKAALPLRDRVLLKADEVLMGDKVVPIAEERARFARNQVSIWDGPARVKAMTAAEPLYSRNFMNPNQLEMLVLPTNEPLGREVFMRLQGYDIYLAGVTKDPIAADGFVRPSRIFRLHDDRHNSLIHAYHKRYQAENKLSPAQYEKMLKQMDVWREDLKAATKDIPDPELKSAVKFWEFNFHHDRGFQMVPSSFLPETQVKGHVPMALYVMGLLSGQKETIMAGFSKPKRTMDKAYSWLRTFWMERLPAEKAIIAGK